MTCWMKRHKPPIKGWWAAHSAFELQFWGCENPKVFWLKVQFQHTHQVEVKSQYLSVTDPRRGDVMSQGSGSPPLQLLEEQETESKGGMHRLLAGWLEQRSLFMMSALSNHFKRWLRKSKAGICVQKPELGSLSKYLDFGSHAAKCLGSNSEERFSCHTWEGKDTIVRFLCYTTREVITTVIFFETLYFVQCFLCSCLFLLKNCLRFLSPDLCDLKVFPQWFVKLMGASTGVFNFGLLAYFSIYV